MRELTVGEILTELEFKQLWQNYIIEDDFYTVDGYIIRYRTGWEEVYAEISKNSDGTYVVTYMD